jgi:cytochrome c peroxidase
VLNLLLNPSLKNSAVMKKMYGWIYLLGLFMCLHFISFTPKTVYTPTDALRKVSKQFKAQLDELDESINHYKKQASLFANGELSIKDLKNAHLQTRLTFKKSEFLIEYIDRQSVKKYLNGPPLLSLEPKVPEIRIIEPSGLQVLDELVFGDSPAEDKEEIQSLVDKLQKEYQAVKKYQYSHPLQHRHIFESIRLELNRVFSLGLTGFDTPGSANAIPEAIESLSGMEAAIGAYLPVLTSKGEDELEQDITSLFKNAKEYLKDNDDFERFNRLVFLTDFVNPLYRLLLEAHNTLQIEKTQDADVRPPALNYNTDNLFSEDLLNAQYYANLDNKRNYKERVALGKLLFYDPILSSNNTRSCASCHNPDKAFTDGQAKSLSLDREGTIKRNAPGLINSVFAEHYFYDLREPHLERQIKHVVLDEKEFNTTFFDIVDKLNQSEAYRNLFAGAYPEHPDYQLSKWSISDALACFISELQAFNSPFDQYVRGEITTIPAEVERGFNLFMGKASCGTCHFAPTFSGLVPPYYVESESEVLGVPSTKDTINIEVDPDLGRMDSGKPIDQVVFYAHSFKTVTVRNAALTAPYMHNGVYDSLEEVMDFYNRGGGAGMGIDLPYQTLPDSPLNLSDQEISDLISFMEALTDTTSLTSIPTELPTFEGKPEWNDRTVTTKY